MSQTDENRTFTICQATTHAMLIPWGRFLRYLRLSHRLRAATTLRCHRDHIHWPRIELFKMLGTSSSGIPLRFLPAIR